MRNAKKHISNRLDILFSEACISNTIKNGVADIRAMFGIPQEGFSDQNEERVWRRKNNRDESDAYYKRVLQLIVKYNSRATNKLPPGINSHLSAYIVSNINIASIMTRDLTSCEIEMVFCDERKICTSTDKRWRRLTDRYVKLYIAPGTSKDSLKKFIDDNWNRISTLLGPTKKVRPINNMARNKAIYDLMQMSRSELKPERGAPKELLVARRLKSKGFDKITDDIVRKEYQKYKKRMDT